MLSRGTYPTTSSLGLLRQALPLNGIKHLLPGNRKRSLFSLRTPVQDDTRDRQPCMVKDERGEGVRGMAVLERWLSKALSRKLK